MASNIRWFLAVAIVVATSSTSAQADTTAICNQIVQTGADRSQCTNTAVSEYTDPTLGVQGVMGVGGATADLSTGALKSSSTAQAYRSGPYDLATGSSSIAELSDTITIGGGYSGVVGIRMDVSGSFLLNVPNAQMGGTVPYPGMAAFLTTYTPSSVDLGTASLFLNQLNSYPNGFVIRLSNPSTSAGGSYTTNVDPITTNFPDPADIHLVLTTTFLVTPSSPTFNVAARISTDTAFNHANDLGDQLLYSAVDFGNSAHLSLMIPDGVPWTSASGVFLQSVPEPGSGAFMALGILCLLSTARRLPG
jgi:hypothetical protein